MAYPLFSLVLLVTALVAAGYWDLRWRRVPNALVVALAVCGLAAQLQTRGLQGAGAGLLAGLAVGALLWFGWTRGRLGGGDLKLAAATGIWVGLGLLPAFILSGAVAGGVISAGCYVASLPEARMRMRANLVQAGLGARLPEHKSGAGRVSVPYALAVAVGAAVALLRERVGG